MAVEGLSKLQQRFRAVPKAMRVAARKAMEKGATEIVAMMKRLCPEDQGELRDSIGWTWGQAPAGSMAVGSVAGDDDEGVRITIYAGNERTIVTNKRGVKFQNARLQEFGTKKMPANTYFFPSIRANRSRARSRIGREVRKAAKEAFGG